MIDGSPLHCHPKIRETAAIMQAELQAERLTVVKSPSQTIGGNAIRAVVSVNPAWYRGFCSQYTSGREKPRRKKHHDTLIKRQHTIDALGRLAAGVNNWVYTDRLLPVVLDECIRIHKQHGQQQQIDDLISYRNEQRNGQNGHVDNIPI